MVSALHSLAGERQITEAAQGHVLTNVNAWSPDGRWLVYDVRAGDDFDGARIERVEVATGAVEVLYESRNGAMCGVATYNPVRPEVVFIHGPENPTSDWQYGFSRRRGAVVNVTQPGVARPLDAMNYAPPFVPGALRGGSHVHVFSPDGQWVSFTYEDDVLAQLDARGDAGPAHDQNLRTIAVSVPAGPVRVARTHPRNNDGEYFSVVVARVVAEPQPGSDEISKAFEEGWVGTDGYKRADGTRQRRALAFQGMVRAAAGTSHAEVFVVDLPEEVMRASGAPLQGTATTRPAPPGGAEQRRLTFTDGRAFPGVAAVPRHWLRVSPDGQAIAFLMKDDAGVVQLWTVSPQGGAPRQVTRNVHDVASAMTWSPDGRRVAHVMDGSVCETEVASGKTRRLTAARVGAEAPLAQACVYSPSGDTIAFTRKVGGHQQIFVVAPGPTEGSGGG
jgi:hypothetical protein